MPPAGAAAFAELEARLREAEERVLRLHFPAQITRVSLTDEDGLVLEPPGQPVEFRVIEHKGEVTLLHTCLIATAAELDYLERAAHLYQTRNTSPSLIVIKPHLVTLAVGHAEAKAALGCGVAVWLDGYRPDSEPRWSKTHLFRSRPRPASGPAPASTTVSPSPSMPPTPRTFTFIPPKTPRSLTPSTSSSSISAPLSASSSADHLANKAAATPAQDIAYLQLDWESLLLSAAIDPPLAASMSQGLAQAGVALPADPRTLPWEELKQVPGVKLGPLTKLRKHVEAKAEEAKAP